MFKTVIELYNWPNCNATAFLSSRIEIKGEKKEEKNPEKWQGKLAESRTKTRKESKKVTNVKKRSQKHQPLVAKQYKGKEE